MSSLQPNIIYSFALAFYKNLQVFLLIQQKIETLDHYHKIAQWFINYSVLINTINNN